MKKNSASTFFKNVKNTLAKKSPEILTGIGIAGMATATVCGIAATPKALKLIELKKEELKKEKLTVGETIKATWKCYVPTLVTYSMSTACLIGASNVNAKRNAILATAYQLSESALTEYKEKVVATIGEKKEKLIHDEIDKDHVEKNSVKANEIIVTGGGDTICYDHYSKRYFKSNMDRISKAINTINASLLEDSYVSLNDFYYEIGLEDTEYGSDIGWNASNSRELIKLRYSSQLDANGNPCLVIDFEVPPKYNFNKFC